MLTRLISYLYKFKNWMSSWQHWLIFKTQIQKNLNLEIRVDVQ